MSSALEKAYKYCQNITKIHAKSFYFASKFLPKRKRRAVYPIYAFCRAVDDEIDECKEERKAIEAVYLWKAKLKSVYQNRENLTEGGGQISISNFPISTSNQVLTAWKDLLQTYQIPENLPFELVEGVLMDTQKNRYETFEELYVYCYRVASTVGLMTSEILGYSDKKALEYAEKMGVAMQLTNILRDVKEDAAMGRIYLPKEDLARFGISEEQIFANKFGQNFREMMKFQVERARNFYSEGEKGIKLLEKDSRFTVLLASRIYARILDEIERLNHNIFEKRAQTTKFQKIISLPGIWKQSRNL